MIRGSLAIVLFLTGCGGKVEAEAQSRARVSDAAASDAPVLNSEDATPPLDPSCVDETDPPSRLECTGLYSDFAKKTVAKGIRHYVPATPLWSDGAHKERYIMLPKGTKIDATDPNEWKFPVGTKVWKEFSLGGKRIETRLYYKTPSKTWTPVTYAWNETDTVATRSIGADIAAPDGGLYHIPKRSECEDCHKGRTDRLLGFEQVSLGLPGAKGTDDDPLLTLADLVAEDLIEPAPAKTSLEIGDDGTGLAAASLAWLHINCGTTCHNDNGGAIAYGAGMRLRLDPTLLDGRSSAGFQSIMTTMGVRVNTPTFTNETRIVPGDPANSLLVKLITTRANAADPTAVQMPPICTHLVDVPDTEAVKAWIAKMPRAAGQEGGTRPPPDGTTHLDSGVPSDPPPPHRDASTPVRDASAGRTDASVDAGADSSDTGGD